MGLYTPQPRYIAAVYSPPTSSPNNDHWWMPSDCNAEYHTRTLSLPLLDSHLFSTRTNTKAR